VLKCNHDSRIDELLHKWVDFMSANQIIPFRSFIMHLSSAVAALLVIGLPLFGRAEDVSSRNPKDGAWIRYQTASSETGDNEDFLAIVTLSMVGTATEDGITYRWIEFKNVIRQPTNFAQTTITKLLIPERDLFESDKPFDHVRRAWVRIGDMPAKRLPIDVSRAAFEPYLLWTPAMLKNSALASDAVKDIEYQGGRLKAAQAHSGIRVYNRPGPNNLEMKSVLKFTA